MLRASIVVIGDELLGGFVRDANFHHIAQRLQAHGVPLDRVHVVPDEFDAIDEALQAELARARPRLVLTTGGIGSTPDDITFEAVAASLGLGVEQDPVLAERLEVALAWTEAQGIEVDDHFRHMFLRMARVPEGSTHVPEAGWAPAVQVEVDGGIDADGGATIVVLPGVPSQCRQIMRDGVEPVLEGRNPAWTVVELPHQYPESVLNPTFAVLGAEHRQVKLGSYPGDPMLVRLQGEPEAVAAAAVVVQQYLDDLDASEAGQTLRAAWTERLARAEQDGAT